MKKPLRIARSLFVLVLLATLTCVGCSKGPPKHGTRLTIAPTNAVASGDQQQALSRAAETLRQRFRDLAVRRTVVEVASDSRLVVTLPELPPERLASCRRAIEKAGLLEFRMVHPDSDLMVARDIPEPGYEVMKLVQRVKKGGREEKVISRLLVNKKPELTGEHIARADVIRDRFSNTPKISFEFDKEGARKFEQVTTEWQPKNGRDYRVAIVLDGELRSAPAIKGVISKYCEITGDFTLKEASELAATLEYPLDLPLHIVDETTF